VKIKLEQSAPTPQPDELEGDIANYLFEVDAASNVEKEITFSTAFKELQSLREWTPDALAALKKNGATIAEPVLTLATQFNQLETTLNERVREQQDLTTRAIALKSEQTRLARLIDSLKSDDSAKQPFVDKLVKSESDLSQVSEKLGVIATQISELRVELESLLKPQAKD
jgi:chromosome segregation ATPase